MLKQSLAMQSVCSGYCHSVIECISNVVITFCTTCTRSVDFTAKSLIYTKLPSVLSSD